MSLLTVKPTRLITPASFAFSKELVLAGGRRVMVYAARYRRSQVRPRLVMFKHETRLLDWCERHGAAEALVGGFYLRNANKPLGEVWLNGQRQTTEPFAAPWHKSRGSLYIYEGSLTLARRNELPNLPKGDFLQAGPLLVQDGVSLIKPGDDPEGFSSAAYQFDTDWTNTRNPRACIGTDAEYIWSVVCDGDTDAGIGLTLSELAAFMVGLGCQQALNLDGGGSASLVTNGQLLNHPHGDGRSYLRGRPIFSAIVFESPAFQL